VTQKAIIMATERQLMDIFSLDLTEYYSKNIELDTEEMNTEEINTEEIDTKTKDNTNETEQNIGKFNFNQTEYYPELDTKMSYNESKPILGEFNLNSTGMNFLELSEVNTEIRYNEIPTDTTQASMLSNNSSTESAPEGREGQSLGDIFFYILFAWVIFNMVDKYLNRNRRRENTLFQEPVPVIDKTEEELNDHLVTKVSNILIMFLVLIAYISVYYQNEDDCPVLSVKDNRSKR